MNRMLISIVSAAAIACAMTTTAGAAGRLQPGQFIGLGIGNPLPEGIFFSDVEDYGKAGNNGPGLGANFPILSWSTPFSFYNTNLILSYSAPFVHQDGGPSFTNLNGGSRIDYFSQALGFTLAHPFGNGFSASYSAFVRTPDTSFFGSPALDTFVGLSYTRDNYFLNATFSYSGTLGSHVGTPTQGNAQQISALTGITGQADQVYVDFSATKKIDHFEFGFVGFASTEINTRLDSAGFQVVGLTGGGLPVLRPYDKRAGSVAVGGLVGYDFGRFIVQTYVTRQIAKRFAYNGTDTSGNFGYGERETRGWLRIIAPLYIAPPAPTPVVARY